MLPRKILVTILFAAAAVFAQQQPPVKVNVLNVCAPAADEQKELSAALAKAPGKPAFSKDYEVARGHSTLDASTPIPGMAALPPGAVSAADWVRVRREFPDANLFSNVQYSFSVDAKNMVETLVLRVRDPKDLMQISIEDSASAVASASAMLSTSTPVSRVKLERFGKSSVVLARCSGTEGIRNESDCLRADFPCRQFDHGALSRSSGRAQAGAPELTRLGVGTAPKTAAGAPRNRSRLRMWWFVSGYRFSDTASPLTVTTPLGAWCGLRSEAKFVLRNLSI